jgi:hypothetical protein
MFSSFDTSHANRHPLTTGELEAAAPSIFASRAMEGVSSRYTYLPTSQIVDRMRQAGWLPVHAQEQRVRLEGRRGFQKHLIRFQREGQEALAKGEYMPEVCLINSHDAGSAYQLHAALFRLVCSNGLMVSDSTFEHVSVRHSGCETQEVLDASFRVLDQVPRIAENVEMFRSRKLTPVESRAFAQGAIMLRWDDVQTAPISPEKLLAPRRHEDAGDNLWVTYNRVQENLLRGGQKDYTRRKNDGHRHARSRAVTGLDENTRLNKALWHMAEALRVGNLPTVGAN